VRRRDLDRAYAHVVQSAAKDEIPMREYRRILVKLAWSYADAQGDAQALGLLSQLTPGYLDEEFPEDAADDTDLLACSDQLAAWLVQRGHVDAAAGDEPCFHVTQAARA